MTPPNTRMKIIPNKRAIYGIRGSLAASLDTEEPVSAGPSVKQIDKDHDSAQRAKAANAVKNKFHFIIVLQRYKRYSLWLNKNPIRSIKYFDLTR